MKRLFVLFLLVLMPLQIVWAATGACCAPDEDAAARQTCQQWQQQCDDADDANDAGAAAADEGCDCCHHFAGGALLGARAALSAPERLPDPSYDPPHYLSHIPDLVPPPDRLLRA